MEASITFENILEQIQSSNLNFHMKLSPFTAVISLKKTLIKDKSGSHLLPPPPKLDNNTLTQKIFELENTVRSLTNDYESTLLDCENTYKDKKFLERELETARDKIEKLQKEKFHIKAENPHTEYKSEQIKALAEDNAKLKMLLNDKTQQIDDLKLSFANSKMAANKLNKEISENKIKFQKDKSLVTKEFKAEIKSWRKELGLERSEKIKIEKKYEDLEKSLNETKMNAYQTTSAAVNNKEFTETFRKAAIETPATKVSTVAEESITDQNDVLCTICAETIENFVPKFFCGEQINPACQECDDGSIESNHGEALEEKIISEANNEERDYYEDYEYLQDSVSYSDSFNLEIWGLDQYDGKDFYEHPGPDCAGT